MIEIIAKICEYFNVTKEQLIAKDKHKHIVFARNYVYYILHVDMGLSLSKTSKLMNRKERNIRARIAEMKHRMKYIKEYQETYETLKQFIHII